MNDKDITQKSIKPIPSNHPNIRMVEDRLCPYCNRMLFENRAAYGCVHCGRVYEKTTMKEMIRI